VRQIASKLRSSEYSLDRDPDVARGYAAQIARRLQSLPCDFVFSPGTIPIAYLDGTKPVAFWADATFGAMLRFYPGFGELSQRAIRNGMELDARALSRASVAFYASEWAAKSAVEDHGADPDRIKVIPFGSNMPILHDRDGILEIIDRRPADSCRLLWVGVDWTRKGGDRAVQIAGILNERDLPTELDVVGCIPPRELPRWARAHGYVDAATEAGIDQLRELYEAAHVLVHPATAECFGVVFCEAAGHGVISAASRVGGIPSAVRDGVTGTLFDLNAPADEYADYIWDLLDDRKGYEARAVRAFDEYELELSWAVQAEKVGSRLADLA
jgi:glycosyltransferase involved in cell wall biosynthesis